MKIGQSSLIIFVSKLFGSVFGFVATLFFARVLGSEVLGIYAVVMALLNWLILGGRIGVSRSMVKRISEGEERGEFLSAGMVIIAMLGILICTGLLVGSGYVEDYVGNFPDYSSYSVVWYLLGMYMLYMGYAVVSSTIKGQNLPHIVGVLSSVNLILRSLIQIGLVLIGYSLVGMLVGYAAGLVIVTGVSLVYVTIRPRFPRKRHFRSLINYAKYSWLSGLKARAFNDVDILVLGLFVPQSLIGVYAVAWSLTNFLNLFSLSVSRAMFPEISGISAQDSMEAASGHIEDSFAYAGLIVIPGFVGGVILDDRILRLYGEEFVQGTEVLWLLLLSIAVYAYLQQCLNTLNGIDRPHLSFRSNLVFIGANGTLNLVLVWQFGWTGAAVASAVSSLVALLYSYRLLRDVVEFNLPVDEIGRQVLASITMGVIVWLLRMAIQATDILQNNLVIVFCLVSVGAAVYFTLLLYLSEEFRATVERNAPFDLNPK